jgi:NDP-sugar pyrophosphorylase family protein
MGVYAFSPRVLDYMTPHERLDFPDLIRRLLEAGEVVRAYRSDCYWLDIGRHDDYEQALEEFERMKHRLIPGEPYGERREGGDRRYDQERRDQGERRAATLERRLAQRRQLPSPGSVTPANGTPMIRRASTE